MLSLLREGFFKGRETWVDLKCEGKEPSVTNKLVIDVIGVIKIQSFTRLVGIGSESEDLHGARRKAHLIGGDKGGIL